MFGELVPRCDLWGVGNPYAAVEDWQYTRCGRAFGHRGLCVAKQAKFVGIPKPEDP